MKTMKKEKKKRSLEKSTENKPESTEELPESKKDKTEQLLTKDTSEEEPMEEIPETTLSTPSSSNPSPDSSPDDKEKRKTRKNPTENPATAGIIYMSSIPPFMTVTRLREMLSAYGELGRVFFKAEKRLRTEGKKAKKNYTEGWLEFKEKKIAKRVALALNNSPVGGKKRAKYKECLWNMKYLHRFHWTHLNEQLRYEKEVRRQRMRNEISQAKREANFFSEQVEKGENLKTLEETILKKGGLWERYNRQVQQKQTVKPKQSSDKETDDLLQMILAE